jgi:hypothetical protein
MVFTILMMVWNYSFHYNHLQSFITSTQYEQMRLQKYSSQITNVYIFSRGEDICEMLLFLSFGVFATLLNPSFRHMNLDFKSPESVIFLISLLAFVFLMVAGVFRTGETARGLLWFYPFFLLGMTQVEDRTLNACIGLAAVQTIAMQLAANYYW